MHLIHVIVSIVPLTHRIYTTIFDFKSSKYDDVVVISRQDRFIDMYPMQTLINSSIWYVIHIYAKYAKYEASHNVRS